MRWARTSYLLPSTLSLLVAPSTAPTSDGEDDASPPPATELMAELTQGGDVARAAATKLSALISTATAPLLILPPTAAELAARSDEQVRGTERHEQRLEPCWTFLFSFLPMVWYRKNT